MVRLFATQTVNARNHGETLSHLGSHRGFLDLSTTPWPNAMRALRNFLGLDPPTVGAAVRFDWGRNQLRTSSLISSVSTQRGALLPLSYGALRNLVRYKGLTSIRPGLKPSLSLKPRRMDHLGSVPHPSIISVLFHYTTN